MGEAFKRGNKEEEGEEKTTSKPVEKDKTENECTRTGRRCKREKIHEVKLLCKQGDGRLLGFQVHCACAQMLFMETCQNQ